jgi:hypothetical protein
LEDREMKKLIMLIVMLVFCCRAFVLNAQPPYTPPAFPECPDGYDLIGQFEGELFAKIVAGYNGVLSITEEFTLPCDADLVVLGFSKEGHPELGCDSVPVVGDPLACTQTQDLEEYDVDVDGGTIGGYDDNQGAGGVENAWFENEEWETTASAGGHNMTFTHRYASQNVGVQSVDYRVSLCAECVVEEDEECRVTAGGNKDNNGTDTWGGQAGAQPGIDGNWTHHHKPGPKESFVFHSNDLFEITCSDPGPFCEPARDAPNRQIDFSGIGRFNNQKGFSFPTEPVCFTVHLEDTGEPGPGSRKTDVDPTLCDHCPGTPIINADDCENCTDYYEIKIYGNAGCEGDPIYVNGPGTPGNCGLDDPKLGGYFTDKGNVQMHPDNN